VKQIAIGVAVMTFEVLKVGWGREGAISSTGFEYRLENFFKKLK
jgi:hypothetical protein